MHGLPRTISQCAGIAWGIWIDAGAEAAVEVRDNLEALYEKAGFDLDETFLVPIGLSFNPYYEFGLGLGIGAHAGPATVVIIDTTTMSGGSVSSDTDVSYIIPVGIDLRYTLFRE